MLHLHDYCCAVAFELGPEFIVEPRKGDTPAAWQEYRLKVTRDDKVVYTSQKLAVGKGYNKKLLAEDAAQHIRIAFKCSPTMNPPKRS